MNLIKHQDIIIKKLDTESTEEIFNLINNQEKEYLKYFTAFKFDRESIKNFLSGMINDKIWGMYLNKNLVGFFMLRGFDEGYEIPSYGVLISKEFSSKGLSKLSLQHAITFCKVNSVKTIMLKVHPNNTVAKYIYEGFGFEQTGLDQKNSNFIYKKKLN